MQGLLKIMVPSDIPPAAVWLLLLDCCPFPSMEPHSSTSDHRTAGHPFDDLDAEALFFEQYYSQHPTPNCSVTEYLGGPAACRRFLARLQAAGKCCQHTEIDTTHTAHSELTGFRSGLCAICHRTQPQSATTPLPCWFSLPRVANLSKNSPQCCKDSDPCTPRTPAPLKPH